MTFLQVLIEDYETKKFLEFKPKRSFYEHVKINRIRFWQLVEGNKVMNVDEARNLALYFQIPIQDFLNEVLNKKEVNHDFFRTSDF